MGDLSDIWLSAHLPLRLLPSEIVPPSPNLTGAGTLAVDWLPEFAGHSWVAYGASSLLVVSHFPSPLSSHQTRIGPLFRQALGLSTASSADVSAVSWCSAASPPSGDLAAAAGDRIFVFQCDSSLGSFCWSQTALLVQSVKVEAIAWTGSGDGIISGGTEVILWKRNIKSWEIAWKFKMKVSLNLVSTTWSLEGPSAAGACPTRLPVDGLSSLTGDACDCVSILQMDGKSGYVSSELRHPQPVTAMQWRPSGSTQENRDSPCARRNVLLTSCLDGAVRLWSEIDDNRIRRGNKDSRDPLTSRRSFCVVAVIEVNQSLKGTLGTDIFVLWALEVEGLAFAGDKDNQIFIANGHQTDEVGRCEWLIGIGPRNLLTFWAIHCLDDVVTTRSPRVTVWNRQEIQGPTTKSSSKFDRRLCAERFSCTKHCHLEEQNCLVRRTCAH